MPGLTLSFSASSTAAELLPTFRRAQELMRHAPDYEQTVDFAAGRLLIGHVAYPGYPILSFERGGFSFLVEGHVYNQDLESLKTDLAELAAVAFREPGGMHHVRRWIQSADGDFVVVIAGSQGEEFVAFTDALGRLPIYVFEDEQQLYLARECKFVAAARGVWELDQLGCAQSLWIGYPLGRRTLMKGIERGGCGFFVQGTTRQSRLDVVRRELVTWSFGSGSSGAKPVRALAADLVELFGTAIRQRGKREEGSPRVVSLSGGHDSRSVAAGLRRFNGEFTAVSREDIGRSGNDWRLAQVIARELQVPWELIRVPEASPDNQARLAWLKDGLNYVGTAFMIEYLTTIMAKHGRRTVYITGDGGDKVFPELRPWRPVATLESLIRELVEEHASGDAGVIEEMMGLEGGTLEQDLRTHVAAYPEERWDAKAVHFSVCERGRKWLFEGEDRNRFFLWQSSPCYALTVFRYSMDLPSKLKRHMRLYREFQTQLWPKLASIDHANVGFPIASTRFRLKTRVQSWFLALPKPAKDAVKNTVRRQSQFHRHISVSAGERVLSLWRQSGNLPALMNETGLRRYLRLATRRSFENILTLALFSAQCGTRPSRC